MEKFDFQNVKFEQNTLKSAKYYDFFAKGFIWVTILINLLFWFEFLKLPVKGGE